MNGVLLLTAGSILVKRVMVVPDVFVFMTMFSKSPHWWRDIFLVLSLGIRTLIPSISAKLHTGSRETQDLFMTGLFLQLYWAENKGTHSLIITTTIMVILRNIGASALKDNLSTQAPENCASLHIFWTCKKDFYVPTTLPACTSPSNNGRRPLSFVDRSKIQESSRPRSELISLCLDANLDLRTRPSCDSTNRLPYLFYHQALRNVELFFFFVPQTGYDVKSCWERPLGTPRAVEWMMILFRAT